MGEKVPASSQLKKAEYFLFISLRILASSSVRRMKSDAFCRRNDRDSSSRPMIPNCSYHLACACAVAPVADEYNSAVTRHVGSERVQSVLCAQGSYPSLELAQPKQQCLAGWFEVRDEQFLQPSAAGLDSLAHFPHPLSSLQTSESVTPVSHRHSTRAKEECASSPRTDSVNVVSKNRSRSALGTPVTRK